MARTLKNRVRETTATTGTGDITPSGAVARYRSFASSGLTAGVLVPYLIEVPSGAWEIGNGTYTATGTIQRTTVEDSSTGSVLTLTGEAGTTISIAATTAAFAEIVALTTPVVSNVSFTGTTKFGTESANNIAASGAATGLSPTLLFGGTDANVTGTIQAKGTGTVNVVSPVTVTGIITAAGGLSTTGKGGARGPIFIQNDFRPDGVTSGQSAGGQVWIGNNPTATPGPNDTVGQTHYVDNTNGRTAVWNVDMIASRYSASSGGTNPSMVRNLELEMLDNAGYVADPFNSPSGRSVSLEFVARAGSTNWLTAASFTWANDKTGAGWWGTGHILSRVASVGLKFVKDPDVAGGGTVDSVRAFALAAIFDASNSVNVLKIDGSHGSIIDLSTSTAIGNFMLCPNSYNTNIVMRNAADFPVFLHLDSGNAAVQQTAIALADRGADKWWLYKHTDNSFGVFNVATGHTALTVAPNDLVTLYSSPPAAATSTEVVTAAWVVAKGYGTGGGAAVVTVASSGATQTLTVPSSGDVAYDITLTANCALTLTGGTVGFAQLVTVLLRQDATAGRSCTLPTNIRWSGGYPPALNAFANRVDLFRVITLDGGTTWTDIAMATGAFIGVGSRTNRYWRLYINTNAAVDNVILDTVKMYVGASTTNLAVNAASASASTSYSGQPASYAIDGVSGSWSSSASPIQWWQYDLGAGQAAAISRLVLTSDTTYYNRAPATFTVRSSSDGVSFSDEWSGSFPVWALGETKTTTNPN